jgi:hypothetical protein
LYMRNKIRILNIKTQLMALFCLWLLLIPSCSPQIEMLQGIVQEVDLQQGAMIIKTSDGEPIKINLDSSSKVKTDSGYLETSCLEPGLLVKVDAEKRIARLVEVNLARLDGNIVSAGNDEIIFRPIDSTAQIKLKTRPFSIIREQDSIVSLSSLQSGRISRIYFNTVSSTVYEINQMAENYTVKKSPEGSYMEGDVWGVRAGILIINGSGGSQIKTPIDADTRIILRDKSPGTIQDVERGSRVRVYFSPITSIAKQIEINPTD